MNNKETQQLDLLVDRLLGYDRRTLQQGLDEGFGPYVHSPRHTVAFYLRTACLALLLSAVTYSCSPVRPHDNYRTSTDHTQEQIQADTLQILNNQQ